MRGDLEPMVADEEEVIRALLQSAELWKISTRNDVPTKDRPEDFWGYASGYVQQRVSGSFELEHISSPFLDLFLQFAYGVDVDLMTHAVRPDCVSCRKVLLNAFTHIEGNEFPWFWEPCGLSLWGRDGRDIWGLDRSGEIRGDWL